jgi:hypothetical protein
MLQKIIRANAPKISDADSADFHRDFLLLMPNYSEISENLRNLRQKLDFDLSKLYHLQKLNLARLP